MNISQGTIDALKESGWHSGRKIDLKLLEEYLISSGYEVFTPVRAFLEEFGMLELKVQRQRTLICGIGRREDYHHTDPKKAIADYYTAGSFKQIEQYAGERLVPVGQINDEYLLLFVSETGKVYCDNGKLGDDFWEAWDNLIQERSCKAWGHY